ncbi:MAG: ATP-binding protein [Denitromonas halophila]|nr:MAG: ATP-binding protein [Denitromonas halophila]
MDSSDSFPKAAPRFIGETRLASWLGASRAGETGLVVAEGHVALTAFEIPSVPDFSSERFPDLARLDEPQRVGSMAIRQAQFLSTLHQLGPSVGLSIRYCLTSTADGGRRIRILLVGRAFGSTRDEAVALADRVGQVVMAAFPREYRIEPIGDIGGDPGLDETLIFGGASSIVEVLKPEQLIQPWHDPELCGFSSYYMPSMFAGTDNTMVTMCGALLKEAAASVIVDVCLVPTGSMTAVEQGEARNWVALCERWSRDQRIETPGGLYSSARTVEIAPDPAARDVGSAYEQLIEAYSGVSRLFLYAIRVISSSAQPPAEAATVLASSALAPGAGYYLRSLPASDIAFARALNAARHCSLSPAVCNDHIWKRDDAPETLRRLHRIATVEELSGFFRLPIPGRAGCPGVPADSGAVDVATSPRTLRREITLGAGIEDNRVGTEHIAFQLKDLTKSALVVGMPGSGKTTLCFSMLDQLWREHHVPFLVLEPAKSEYRALQTMPAFRDDLWVFTVGNERASPFRLNPFDVPDGVAVSEHISGLVTCFSGAFDLWDPLPMIIEQAIRDAYEERGWSEYELGGERPELEPPTMQTVFDAALNIARKSSYAGESAGNIKGALEARLGSLLSGPKGRCFNNRRSIPLFELLSRPIVLELDALNEDEKALLMMFMLTLIREYAKATRRSGAPLSHVLLVEEAHVVIGRGDSTGTSDRGNPKGVAIRLFTRAIAEMRALGEGIVIADQLPTAIAPEAIKNTSIKVMHRLVSADDRSELGQAMIFDSGQIEQAATLSPGRAFVHMEGWPRSRLVAEPDFKAIHEVEEPPDDRYVAEVMETIRSRETIRPAFLPYPGCEGVCHTCTSKVREEMERARRGAFHAVSQEADDLHEGDYMFRVMEEFKSRVNTGASDEHEVVESSIKAFETMSPQEQLRTVCADVISSEIARSCSRQNPRGG